MTTRYEDPALLLDDAGITIKNHLLPGRSRHIPYETIRSTEVIALGPLSGRHRVVGIGFRRPRHFFHWDRSRSAKRQAIAFDTGRLIHTVISPDDTDRVLSVLEEHLGQPTG